MSKIVIKQICRSCLEPAVKMYPLIGEILNVDVNIATMLSFCTKDKFDLNEDLPDGVCIPCFKTIRIAYNFLVQFKESQEKLKCQMVKTRDKLKEIQVDNPIVYDNIDDEEKIESSNENIEYVLEESNLKDDTVTAVDLNCISYDLGTIHNYAGKMEPEEVSGISFEEEESNLNIVDSEVVSENETEDYKPSMIEYVVDSDVKDNLPSSSDAGVETCIIITAEDTPLLNPVVRKKKYIQKDETYYGNDYACPMCNKKFYRLPKFQDHILLHNSDVIVCNKCPRQVELNTLEYIQHYKDTHRYQCNICDRSLRSSYGFRYHMKHHENIRQYTCPVAKCNKSYFLHHLLLKHMYTHSETIKHTCNLCGATFRTYDTYRYHQKTHDGTRNHLCTMCGKAFFQAVHLRDHIFRHTGYKRFTCDMCGTSFTTNSQLKKHLIYCRRFKAKSIKKEVA